MTNTLLDKYQEGLDVLYLFSEPFGKLVHAMGQPVFEDSKDRAKVQVNPDTGNVEFVMDRKFLSSLDYDEDIAFVLLHEALHVAWNHLEALGSDEYPVKPALVIALECVINDSIEKLSGIAQPDQDGPAGDYITGPEKYGKDFFGMTTKEAYEYVLSQMPPEEQTMTPPDMGCSMGGEDGSGSGGIEMSDEDIQTLRDAVKDAFKDDQDGLEDVLDGHEAESKLIEGGIQSSALGGATGFRDVNALEGLEFDFVELLAKINPKIKDMSGKKGDNDYKNDWTKPRHSMRSFHPEVIIPQYKKIGEVDDGDDDQSVNILFATDQSSSIPQKYVDISMDLLDSVPDDLFVPHMAVWADNCEKYEKGQFKPNIGYGTEIDSVFNYAKALKRSLGKEVYPVVFTDGGYWWNPMMTEEDKKWIQECWTFVAYDKYDVKTICTEPRINRDNVYFLGDLYKKGF